MKPDCRAQGSLEYLLLIGGALVVASLAVVALLAVASGGGPPPDVIVGDMCKKATFNARVTDCSLVTVTFGGVEYECEGTYPSCGPVGPVPPPVPSCHGPSHAQCSYFSQSNCPLGQCALTPAACTGDPDCSSYSGNSACDSAGGGGICEGIVGCDGEVDCESISSQAECDSLGDGGVCFWGLSGLPQCEFFSGCGTISAPSTCNSVAGCSWGNVACNPSQAQCSGGPFPACASVPGCSQTSACAGTFDCAPLSASACNGAAPAGCSWS